MNTCTQELSELLELEVDFVFAKELPSDSELLSSFVEDGAFSPPEDGPSEEESLSEAEATFAQRDFLSARNAAAAKAAFINC